MQTFLLALALGIDGFFWGLSLGLKKIIIPLPCRAVIGLASMLVAFLCVLGGKSLALLLPETIAKVAGAALLLLTGVWILSGVFFKKKPAKSLSEKTNLPLLILSDPPKGDMDGSGVIDCKEAFFIGLALSVDMLGCGFGLGAVGFSPLALPLWVGLMQTLTLSAGGLAAGFIKKAAPEGEGACSFLSGLLLILLSIYRLF